MIDKDQKRLLVVGGTGFIGSYLIRTAVNLGFDCSVLSLNAPQTRNRIQGVNYLVADLSDRSEVFERINNLSFEYVVNLGGYIDHRLYTSDGRKVIDVHLIGLINLIDALDRRILKRFVQVGSSDEYGGLSAPQKENRREEPISPYSFAKVASTHFLQMLFRTEKFPVTILRLFLVYGEGQDQKRFIPQIINSSLKGVKFPVSHGKQLRDFCHVEDVTRGIILAMQLEESKGEIINIASGVPITIKNIIKLVTNLIGSGEPVYGQVPYRTQENMHLFASVDKAKKILGWEPSIDIHNGLRRTIRFYEQMLNINYGQKNCRLNNSENQD